MRASCISTGTLLSGSCFAFPLALGIPEVELTREFNGARTKDVSAMKDGSVWPEVK
jgi:hypothetical protein